MRHAYEILCDPTDRYLLWDLVDDAPVVSASRIVTFEAVSETRRFLEVLCNRARPSASERDERLDERRR